MLKVKIGETLPNGTTLLAIRGEGGDRVVLADCGAPHEHWSARYATWRLSPGDYTGRTTCCGHYFKSIAEAARDFEVR